MASSGSNEEIVGEFRVNVDDQLGSGTFAIVYLAKPVHGGTDVAAKRVKVEKEYLIDGDYRRQGQLLLHEIPPHRNIIKAHDVIEKEYVEGRIAMVDLWLILGYCPLGNLSDYAATNDLSTEKKLELIYQLALAVRHLQECKPQSVAHRNIKPQSTLVSGSSTRPVVKLGSFSTARTVINEDGHSELMSSFCGTPGFMTPEMLPSTDSIDVAYDKSVDTYATALTALALLDSSQGSRMKFLRINGQTLAEFMKMMNKSTDLTASHYSPPIHKASDNDLEKAIKDVLQPMLSFSAADRPSMAEVVQRLSALRNPTATEVLLAVHDRSVWEREGKEWVQLTAEPDHRLQYICFCGVLGGIMAVGGWDRRSNSAVSKCFFFSVLTRCWRRVADMITARYRASAAVLDDSMMVFGGEDGIETLDECERFHITDNDGVWSPVASLLKPVVKPLVATAAGTVFVLPNEISPCTAMQQYKVSENQFSWAAPTPNNIETSTGASLVSVRDKLYLVGGWHRLAIQYNPTANQWAVLLSQPLARCSFGCTAVLDDGKILLCGGRKGSTHNGVDEYNLQTRHWARSDIILPFDYDQWRSFVCSINF